MRLHCTQCNKAVHLQDRGTSRWIQAGISPKFDLDQSICDSRKCHLTRYRALEYG